MLIVVDTSVLVGACRGSRACGGVVASCLQGVHRPLVGAALFAEYEAVLGRETPWRRSRLSRAEREDLFDAFLAVCSWTRVYFGWRPNLRDEDDNHLVELAVAGGATRIVTRNVRDFAAMELTFAGLEATTPEAFLKEFP